jgi:hypothetical protein
MGGFAQAPGSGNLIQQTFNAPETAGPGKRTLTEQLTTDTPAAPPHGTTSSPHPLQRAPAHSEAGASKEGPADLQLQITPPQAGIDKAGFIDNSKGALIYNKPTEAGGERVRDAPLPPAARVFVSGTHPRWKHWWYITAYLEQAMVRGYVEDFRVTTDLPEPLAELHHLVGGETAEGLAKEKFGGAVTDGHDLRYYENVLLYVNRGRAGVTGTYQDPGVLGGGSNNIQLEAGHRLCQGARERRSFGVVDWRYGRQGQALRGPPRGHPAQCHGSSAPLR